MSEHHSAPIRSWLFTPATRPERFAKAGEVGADVLIADLEDAVAPDDKPKARTAMIEWLGKAPTDGVARALRINGLDTRAGIDDLHALLAQDAAPDYLVLPKTEGAGHIAILDRLLTAADKPTRIVGIVESIAGLDAVQAIAKASQRLAGLMLGAADMAADIGCDTAWDPLVPTRARIVAACAAAGIAVIDSPFFDTHDIAGCTVEVERAKAFGFIAKAAIHPSQIASINKVLTPTDAQIAEAREILAENKKGVGTVNGQMIDEAVARKARRVLAAAGG